MNEQVRIIHRRIDPSFNSILRPLETDHFFRAVKQNAFRDFRCLAKVKSVNRTNARGYTLLEHVIRYKRVEMFDYLLTLDNLEIDRLDACGQSPFLFSVECSSKVYFALELIKKGANIDLKDNRGETALHKLVCGPVDDRMQLTQLLIEKGADLNAQDNEGETPLYKACKKGSLDWIYMLLYHGASATIPSDQEVLPVAIVSTTIFEEERLQVEGILFDHTFDVGTNSVPLATLVQAMRLDSTLFTRIVDVVPDVTFEMHELEQLSDWLSLLNPKHFELFLVKFSNIVRQMIENYPPFANLVKYFVRYPTRNIQEMMQLILESDLIFDFVQSWNWPDLTIGKLIKHKLTPDPLNEREIHIEDEEVVKIVYILLTYGFNVKSSDLDIVYSYYGCCELFKVLLHMDIQVLDKCQMARLYYDPNTRIESFCNENAVSVRLLCYYNHPKLKEVCFKEPVGEEIVAKAKTLPTLPCLVELSRNAARYYIINRYNIKNSMQFYTILKSLPIGQITKRIIALEIELY